MILNSALNSSRRALCGTIMVAAPILIAACATTNSSQPHGTAAADAAAEVDCPVGFQSDAEADQWAARVEAARELTDPAAKRDSMLALVRDALSVDDLEVRPVGTSSEITIEPVDYRPAPVINFDMNLGVKRRDEGNAFFFSFEDEPYVILGPGSLHTRGPVTTRAFAEHELYHARYHMGDSRPLADRELEVWTHVFTDMFHEMYPHMMRWSPLVSFYEEASPVEQRLALRKLVDYYNNPPSPPIAAGCVDEVQAEFMAWFDRRINDERTASSQLVADLRRELMPTDG